MWRIPGMVLILASLQTGLWAAEPGGTENPAPPSEYQILRFDENYSYLANPTQRTDPFDPLKYIPLSSQDSTFYLTLGGEWRERFESYQNPDFGIQGKSDSYLLQRITLLADLHLGDRLRFYVEGISGLVVGETMHPPPPQKDPLNLQFAFIDLVPYLTDDESFTMRFGRFGMSLGSGRLVATRAAPNIPFKFDGLELLYNAPLWQATAFLTRPVNESSDQFDRPDQTTSFWGLYGTRWLDATHDNGVDLYYLGIHREYGAYTSGRGMELRHSIGSRLFGKKNHWDWNGEGVVQFGSFGDQSILAWTASLDTGYTVDVPLHPRIGLKTDVASGDRNPEGDTQGTFDGLFFKSGYFNDASLLRPENIIDVHPNLSLELTKKLSINGGADFLWRYSRNDGIYAPPGFVALPAIRANSPYVGTALDVNLEWQLQRHITFEASYVHMFTGSYVREAGGGDVNYVSATLSFLF